ncbi:MAG: glucans biosynthesis glucosyltransferase MdoH [Hyphomicrobium sp.]
MSPAQRSATSHSVPTGLGASHAGGATAHPAARPIELAQPGGSVRGAGLATGLLPQESPLAMPAQDFSKRIPLTRERRRRGYWVPRAAVFFGSALMTAAFAVELHAALSLAQMTPFQFVFLVLATLSFGWIALGTLSAAMGFLPLFASEPADTIDVSRTEGTLGGKVALLLPVYHEDASRIAGTISGLATELQSMGRAGSFDIFVLSDTRGDEAGAAEEARYAAVRSALAGTIPVYYRRRPDNKASKAGNIHDWVERFGGAYESFVILDADSIMTGDTLLRLALAMEGDPKAGLIQTVPRLAGGTTLLQKLQQFASNTYGPSVAAGIAFWHRDQGNYWGHNAIIRTRAFAAAAGLPELPGKAPFGGSIQSHDFVEAVLLQRAGWGVHMVPSLGGSFEGAPPTLLDLTVRDRRWAQGNLQHLAILGSAGLTPMGRVHLSMGAASYLISVVWAASLAVGAVLALQGQQLIPSYFQDSKTLFPIWPVMDPGAAMRLFLTTMAVVLLPKALGLILEIKRAATSRELFGMPRAIAGVATETLFSILIAPILMMTQTAAVFEILLRRDSGWKTQRRDGAKITLAEAVRWHGKHALAGLALAALCWQASPGLLLWMSPVILGLLLSGPVHWLTAHEAGPVLSTLLTTEVDRNPAAILARTDQESARWALQFAVPSVEAPTEAALKTAA